MKARYPKIDLRAKLTNVIQISFNFAISAHLRTIRAKKIPHIYINEQRIQDNDIRFSALPQFFILNWGDFLSPLIIRFQYFFLSPQDFFFEKYNMCARNSMRDISLSSILHVQKNLAHPKFRKYFRAFRFSIIEI